MSDQNSTRLVALLTNPSNNTATSLVEYTTKMTLYAMAWATCFIAILLSVSDVLLPNITNSDTVSIISDTTAAIAAMVLALWIRHVSVQTAPYVGMLLLIVILFSMVMDSREDVAGVLFGYLIIITVAAAVTILNRRAYAGSLLACIIAYFFLARNDSSWPHWVLPCLTAMVLSLVLHRLRYKSLHQLSTSIDSARVDALHDLLTGLLNRRGLYENVKRLLSHDRKNDVALNVAFIDVDKLKKVNDTAGHNVGDALLRGMAAALLASTRAEDLVARWGGDEFVVVTTNLGLSADELERRIIHHLVKSPPVPRRVWQPCITVGSASCSLQENPDFDELLTRADVDMYSRRNNRVLQKNK